MPARSLTKDELNKKRIKKQVDEYMESVNAFIEKKNGSIPAEWGASLMLLRAYYEEFIALSIAIDELDSFTINGRYGVQPNSLLSARNSAAIRLESCLQKYGLEMKSATKLNVVEVKPEESVLDKFLKNKTEIEER